MKPLPELVARGLAGRHELREEELTALVASVTGLEGARLRQAARATDDLIVTALGEHSTLHARPGGWVLRLTDAAATGALATALTGAVLAIAGIDQLPAIVLPAVLPLLIDLDRVELSAGDGYVLARLRLQPDVVAHARTPEKLYDRLPAGLRDQIALPDFLDFVERLILAGEADRTADGRVMVRHEHDPAWVRLRIR